MADVSTETIVNSKKNMEVKNMKVKNVKNMKKVKTIMAMKVFNKKVKEIEGEKTITGKTEALANFFEELGYSCVSRKRGSGQKFVQNIYYYKDDSEYVLGVIATHNDDNQVEYDCVSMDKRLYKNYFVDDNAFINCNRTYKYSVDNKDLENINDYREPRRENFILKGATTADDVKLNILAVFGKVDMKGAGIEIDHETHSCRINFYDCLRQCTVSQNNMNKEHSLKIEQDRKEKFYFKRSIKNLDATKCTKLENLGFSVSRGKNAYNITSPKCATENEAIKYLNTYETTVFGKYRYNPLRDFEETWYALILCRVLGLSDKVAENYNKSYIRAQSTDYEYNYMCLRYGIKA